MERIDRSIERELTRSGDRSVLSLTAITAVWPEVLGEHAAKHAWPLRIGRDGTLHVATTSATWAFELDRLAPEIVEKLAARLRDDSPTKLRFAVGPVPEPGVAVEPEAAGGALRESPAELPPEAVEAVSEVDDPELRDLIQRAARASLSRPPSDRRF
ncbi:MAG TPA: DUF721 domain-containing protein [Gaiellaceae bacterium]|nr:DUF721 domain-containing protein [Gaiellaceae bacterium]